MCVGSVCACVCVCGCAGVAVCVASVKAVLSSLCQAKEAAVTLIAVKLQRVMHVPHLWYHSY